MNEFDPLFELASILKKEESLHSMGIESLQSRFMDNLKKINQNQIKLMLKILDEEVEKVKEAIYLSKESFGSEAPYAVGILSEEEVRDFNNLDRFVLHCEYGVCVGVKAQGNCSNESELRTQIRDKISEYLHEENLALNAEIEEVRELIKKKQAA